MSNPKHGLRPKLQDKQIGLCHRRLRGVFEHAVCGALEVVTY